MSNSPSFPNMPSDSQLPDIGVTDPNNSALDMDDSNVPSTGKTKISPTDKSGPAYSGTQGYGFDVADPELKIQGMAPSGENSSGIPAAQPIPIMTYGDPNNTAIDKKDGFGLESNG